MKRRKVYARIKAAVLAEMRSLSSFNWNFKYLLRVIVVFTKHTWVKRMKDKKAKIVLHGFIEIANYRLIKKNNFIIAFCKNG